MQLFFFLAILMLPTLAACTQQPGLAPVMIANPILVEENAYLAEAKVAPPPVTANNTAKPPPQPGQQKQPDKGYYWVKFGDSLSAIALATGRDPQKLAEWNQISPPYQVRAGQKLRLFAPSATNIGTGQTIVPPPVPKLLLKKQAGAKPLNTATSTAEKTAASGKNATVKVTALPEKNLGVPPQALNSNPDSKLAVVPVLKNQVDSKNVAGQQENNPNQKSQLPVPVEHHSKLIKLTKSTDPKTVATIQDLSQKKSGISIDNKKMLKLNFQWPVKGAISKSFSQTHGKGIDIASKQDKLSVNAAEAGKVVYQGQGLAGFKNLIIIKHDDEYLSAYANNSRLLVKEGQQVSKGQAIAEIGAAGSRQKPLHFEIRKNGNPINPLDLLPK